MLGPKSEREPMRSIEVNADVADVRTAHATRPFLNRIFNCTDFGDVEV